MPEGTGSHGRVWARDVLGEVVVFKVHPTERGSHRLWVQEKGALGRAMGESGQV